MLLFGPQFLLSMMTTLKLSGKASLNILTRHPSLIILPTVTFFTFSRIKIGCCADESKVVFSKKFTWVNFAVSSVGYLSWAIWLYFRFRGDWVYFNQILPSTLSPLLLSMILTILLLHLDKLSCCSDCCLSPGEQLSVYDPLEDKRYIMVNGKIEDVPEDDEKATEDDVEAGNNSCCGGDGAGGTEIIQLNPRL